MNSHEISPNGIMNHEQTRSHAGHNITQDIRHITAETGSRLFVGTNITYEGGITPKENPDSSRCLRVINIYQRQKESVFSTGSIQRSFESLNIRHIPGIAMNEQVTLGRNSSMATSRIGCSLTRGFCGCEEKVCSFYSTINKRS